jgi:hypothetical protein
MVRENRLIRGVTFTSKNANVCAFLQKNNFENRVTASNFLSTNYIPKRKWFSDDDTIGYVGVSAVAPFGAWLKFKCPQITPKAFQITPGELQLTPGQL